MKWKNILDDKIYCVGGEGGGINPFMFIPVEIKNVSKSFQENKQMKNFKVVPGLLRGQLLLCGRHL